MFSVVIPLYNKEAFIKQTLTSVLEQSYTNFEVIIVNDGCTDKSIAIVEEVNAPQVSIISKKNGGPGSARNLGIKKARYPYIAFLDADDTWEIDFLKEMSIAIQKVPNQGIYTAKTTLKWKNRPFTEVHAKGEYLHINPYIKYIHEFYCNSSSVVIPKSIFESVGYFLESYNVGEDNEMWVRIGLKHEVLFINKSLACYNDVSTYHATRENQALAPYPFIIDTIVKHYQKPVNELPFDSARSFCQKIIVNYCISCIKKGRKDLAREYVNKENLPKSLYYYVKSVILFPPLSNVIPLYHLFKKLLYKLKG